MASQQQLRETITDQIIAALESGDVPPWRRPWRVGPNAGFPANVVSKKPYRGINPILLDLASARHSLTSKWWATFNQWKGLGGKVMRRPAARPRGPVGHDRSSSGRPITKTERGRRGRREEDRYFVMRSYTVFNVDQVEGDHLDHLRAGHADTDSDVASVIDYEPAEEAIAATGITHPPRRRAGVLFSPPRISSRCRRRRRSPSRTSTTRRSSTNSSTPPSIPTRLNWSRKETENTYAMGELVAEIGACYLARELGVPASENLTNHVAYLANWLKAMKDDPPVHLHGLVPGVEGRRLPPRLQPPRGRRGARAGGGPGRVTDPRGGGTNAAHRHRPMRGVRTTPPERRPDMRRRSAR